MARICILLIISMAVFLFSSVTCYEYRYLVPDDITYAESSKPLHRGSSAKHRVRRDVLNSTEITMVVNEHNRLRRLVGSSNMKFMSYDSSLASGALLWAENCQWNHGQLSNSMDYNPVGQNLFAIQYFSGVTLDLIYAIQIWFNETMWYNYDTGACQTGKPCGHYTQVAWAATLKIGCAYYTCTPLSLSNFSSAIFLVCNYGPAGNYIGQKPFLKGPACSQCDGGSYWCNGGLCDSGCPGSSSNCVCNTNCNNNGYLNPNTCTCTCMSGWTGTDCSSCSRTCSNGGSIRSDCTCACTGGWNGPTCNCMTTCYNGGSVTGSCGCTCPSGFYGNTCSCTRSCYGSATLNSDCTCTCPSGWCGSDCSSNNQCPSSSTRTIDFWRVQTHFSVGIILSIFYQLHRYS